MDNELNEHHEREPYYEDEIDLYQLIQVLLKRKKLIASVFLVVVIVTIAASYIMKPVYRVSAVVAPGQVYEQEPVRDALIWREKDIDTPENIERLISQNPFHYEILTQLSWDYQDPQNQFDIKTNVQERTNYIFVNIDSSEPERAKEYFAILLDKAQSFYLHKAAVNATLLSNDLENITADRQKIIQDKQAVLQEKKLLSNEKKRILNEKQRINNQIEFVKNKHKVLDSQSARLERQIKEIQINNEQIIKQRDAVLAKEHNPTDSMSLLLYSNTIQENLTQIDRLNLTLEDNYILKQQLQQEIKDLEMQLANLDLQLADIDVRLANLDIKSKNLDLQDNKLAIKQKDLEAQKANISGLRIVQEPTIDPQRVSPKRTLMVAVAGVLGLFVGIFAAFAAEFWQSHKVSA